MMHFIGKVMVCSCSDCGVVTCRVPSWFAHCCVIYFSLLEFFYDVRRGRWPRTIKMNKKSPLICHSPYRMERISRKIGKMSWKEMEDVLLSAVHVGSGCCGTGWKERRKVGKDFVGSSNLVDRKSEKRIPYFSPVIDDEWVV